MIKMNKWKLALMAVLALTTGVSSAHAASANSVYQLDGIVVMGNRENQVEVGQPVSVNPDGYTTKGVSMGYLGMTDVMKSPFTQTGFAEKTIEDYGDPSQPINGVIVNMPSVKTSGTTMYNDFSIRGQNLNGYQIYLNGIPGMFKQANTPINYAERVEVTAGPNKGITGTSANESAGGVVNIVSKRAIDNFTDVKTSFSGRGTWGQEVDFSHRFGDNKEWGLRVNAENVDGHTAVHGEKLTNRDITINIDHKTDKSYTNLFMGYFYSDLRKGQRWFGFKGKDFKSMNHVLKAPKSSRNFGFDGMDFKYDDWAVTLNHEQKLSDNWKFFFNAGYNRYDLYNNVNSKSSKYFIINNKGDFEALNWVQNFPITTYYGQLGLSGIVNTGEVKHNLVFAIDKSWYDTYRNLDSTDQKNQKFNTPNGNIYTGVPDGPFTNYNADKVLWNRLGSKARRWSWSVNDHIEYGKLGILLGYFNNHSKTFTYNKNGDVTNTARSSADCPTYGIVYSPNDNWSFYANHAESFNMESVVSSKYTNVNEILPAAKTKQNEVGVKYLHNDLLTSFTYFDIKKAGNIDVTENDKLYLRQDGEDEYEGVELSVTGKLAPKWNIIGGAMYMDAKHNTAAKRILDGERISGASRWNGVLALEYLPNDNFSVFGRILYNGSAQIWNSEITNKLRVPSYTTLDLGVKYKTSIDGLPVTFRATCYNVLGRDYWIPKSGVDTVIVSNPRTFVLSARVRL